MTPRSLRGAPPGFWSALPHLFLHHFQSSLHHFWPAAFAFDEHMVMIYVALLVMSAIIVGVGGLGLATTMSLNVLERRREMGVLRAIGATPRAVWGIVAAEGAVVGLLGGLVAALAAWPTSKAIGDLLVGLMFKSDLDFRFELRGLLIWLAASVVLGAAASFLPAWHASRGSVREALAYE